MKNGMKGIFLFVLSLTVGICQLSATEAQAQSSYFTSRGCVSCHATPVAATCNGCHHHGNASLKAATNKTSYDPGETVTATLSGGSRSGWIRAALYDQTGAQVAVSNGNASGMGGSATFPAALTAAAPATAGTYTWKMEYYGNADGNGHSGITVNTNAFSVTAPPAPAPADTTAPTVSAFSIPATSATLAVSGIAVTAADNVAVTGYKLTESASAPLASATGWTASAPATYTFASEGVKTLYAWAKDAAGNVSGAKSAQVTITLPVVSTPPVLSVSTLANGAFTNIATLNVSGQATDADGIQAITVNGKPVALAQNGSFTSAVALVEGANTITVVATDATGSQKSDVRTITYDPAAPILNVQTPADNGTSAASFVTVTGTVNENSNVVVTDTNGNNYTASITGNTFTTTVNLADGINTLTITATDLAGNTVSAKRTITFEGTQMTVAITSPSQDLTTKKKTLVVTGKIVDATGKVSVKVKVDTKVYKASVSKKGIFKKKIAFKAAKQYAITVTATDKAGNVSTAARNVIYAPEVKGDDDDDDDDKPTIPTTPTTPTTPAPATHAFGWTNPRASHQDYVTSSNVSSCTSCHSIDPASQGKPMSCFNCHGNEWGTPSTGGTTGGTTTPAPASHPFGWTNPRSSHQNYVTGSNVSSCTSCHSTASTSKGQPMSCYNCHGKKW